LRIAPIFVIALTLCAEPAFIGKAIAQRSGSTAGFPQNADIRNIATGVWFLKGGVNGSSNTAVIEMDKYLIVVDANYPGRAKELLQIIPTISPKPVKYVFDTHAHGDHSYGNSIWTSAGATTMAFSGVSLDMDKWEPTRWQQAAKRRKDMQDTGMEDVQRPQKSLSGNRFTLKDGHREVEFISFGWGHTEGDGYVWLPRERVLCTGDGAVNGPYNKIIDANLTQWPQILDRALRLKPRYVLPGHGEAGGPEILEGQAMFLRELRKAVSSALAKGQNPEDTTIDLPQSSDHWVPHAQPSLWRQDIVTMALELSAKRPAGSLPHEWR